jgi:hypothetical protein
MCGCGMYARRGPFLRAETTLASLSSAHLQHQQAPASTISTITARTTVHRPATSEGEDGRGIAGRAQEQMSCICHMGTFVQLQYFGKMGRSPSLAPADQGSLTTDGRLHITYEMQYDPGCLPVSPFPSRLNLPIQSLWALLSRSDQLSGCSLCTCISAPI